MKMLKMSVNMRKFFRIYTETDYEIVGNIGEDDQGYIINESYENLPYKNLYKNSNLSVIEAILNENSKLTDILSISNTSLLGLAVRQKFKTIIEKYSLAEIQFVPIKFLNKPSIKNYYFAFFNSDLTEHIDYQKTKFVLKKKSLFRDDAIQTPIHFYKNNREELIIIDKEIAGSTKFKLLPKTLYYFKNKFDYDVFRIGHYNLGLYFWEIIKLELISRKLKGFYFSTEPLEIDMAKNE